MPPKQNPFSIYDFLGYFVPGALFLLGASAFAINWNPHVVPLDLLTAAIGAQRAELYIPLVLVAYALGHILSFVSSVTVERYSIWKFDYPSKYLLDFPVRHYFDVEEPKVTRKVLRVVVWLALLPFSLLDYFFGDCLSMRELYAKKLDKLLITLIWGKLNALVSERSGITDLKACGKPMQLDFFRFAYHFVLEHAPGHQAKMQNYVAIYGFLRTLCLLCVVSVWAVLVSWVCGHLGPVAAVCLLPLLSAASFVFFMAFMKFYRRFSLEALMALCVVYPVAVR